ncbi:mitochondrial import inner membrane translocase subunit Tim17-B isoform X2 [Varanus komodoensis]|uniref:mitochondrial import inner membrane translocase subunit Tim17-B isoform X2 n=1 Tax=Varanus komodoensis TaxID=61221 RepID=UPI001CF77B6C|nr:mitochondrial import inner membrane translocase subunit Tim17-B isoform X2 [Varanus komodoensis]
MEEYAREPCPWRIVDDCGGAFTMGMIGGGVFQAVKGFRNAPVEFFRTGCQTSVQRQLECNQSQSTTDWRQLCSMGWAFLYHRLWPGENAGQGGSLELHHQWGTHWGCASITQWTIGHGRFSYDGRHLTCPDRRCWDFADQIHSPAIPESQPLWR